MALPPQENDPQLPHWWHQDLYLYVSERISLRGWVWEFMRRYRIKQCVDQLDEPRSADVMNPIPHREDIPEELWKYYSCWNNQNPPYQIYLPLAIQTDRLPNQNIRSHAYEIGNQDTAEFIDMRIDINRRDRVLFREFKNCLKELRNDYPQPQDLRPRPDSWSRNMILEVWDLRQFNLSYVNIARALSIDALDSDPEGAKQYIRNSLNTAIEYIDEMKWLQLARYIE